MGAENQPTSSELGSEESQPKTVDRRTLLKGAAASAALFVLGQGVETEAALLPGPVEQNGEEFIDWDLEQTKKASAEDRLENYMNNILYLAKGLPEKDISFVAKKLFDYLKSKNYDTVPEDILGHADEKRCSREEIIKIVKAMRTEIESWLETTTISREKRKGILNGVYTALIDVFKKED